MGFFNIFKSVGPPLIDMDEVFFDESNKKEFFSKYYDPRIPVLIKGGAKNWSLINNWTKEYLIKNAGNYMCTVVSDSRPAVAKEQTSLKDYFENHSGKSTLTLDRYSPSNDQFFFKDIKLPNAFFNRNKIKRFFFYHSIKDAGTLPHNHRDAFNILKDGEKHWVMHDARQSTSPKGFQVMMHYFQKYPPGSHAKDWFRKELKTLTNKVDKVYQCIQKPGDIVFVPVEYSHVVLNHSEVMGLVVETLRN